MAKSIKQLLAELAAESGDARSEMNSAKTGLRRPGEESDSSDDEDFLEDEEEQDLDSDEESDDELDEESDEDEDDEEEEDDEESDESDEDEEEDDSDEDERSDNATAAQRRILAKKDKEITRLSEQLESLKGAATKQEQEDILAEMKPLADELKLDPRGLAKIAEKMVAIAEKRLSSKLPSDEEMARNRQREDTAADAEYFGGEWKGFQSDVIKQYPRATARQIEQAKEKMDEIAHDPKRGGRVYAGRDGKERLLGYPLDFLMHKYKRDFDSILSNKKRHGLESSNIADSYESDDEPDVSTSKGVDQLDRQYRNLEASSSGIRRGRRPRSRRI